MELLFGAVGAAHSPYDLSQNPHPYRHIGGCEAHSQDQPPDLTLVGVGGMTFGVSGLLKGLDQEGSESLDFACGSRLRDACACVASGLADQLVEAYCCSLAQVHRGVAELF